MSTPTGYGSFSAPDPAPGTATDATSAPSPSDPSPAVSRKPLAVWLWFLTGIGLAIVGLLPWIVTGMRLPLQNLWATDALPWDMPVVLLPFSQYSITEIVALIGVGSTLAGLVVRATRSRQNGGSVVAVLGGVLLVQLIAIVQTSIAVQGGLQPRSESFLYLGLLIGVAGLATILGAVALWLIARAPRAGALIGSSLGAVAVGSWLSALIVPVGYGYADWQLAISGSLRWIPAILVGVADSPGGGGRSNRVGRTDAAAQVAQCHRRSGGDRSGSGIRR